MCSKLKWRKDCKNVVHNLMKQRYFENYSSDLHVSVVLFRHSKSIGGDSGVCHVRPQY